MISRSWSGFLFVYRIPLAVYAHCAALLDPLHFGVGLTVCPKALILLQKGIRSSRPQARPPQLEWSLHRVLHYLSFEELEVTLNHSLQQAHSIDGVPDFPIGCPN